MICICSNQRKKTQQLHGPPRRNSQQKQSHMYDMACNTFFAIHILFYLTYKRQNCVIRVLNRNTNRAMRLAYS